MGAISEHDRDWRPVVLAFSDDASRRERIIRFASWIESGSGLTTAVRLVQGEGIFVREESAKAEEALAAEIRQRGLEAFARIVTASDLEVAFPVLLQTSGLGPIRPNLALFNWFDQEETAVDAPAMRSYGSHLRTALRYGCNVVVLAAADKALAKLATENEPRRIDIWWRGDASSKLGLLLAYLMSRREPWSRARLRVLTERAPDATGNETMAGLQAELEEARIPAEVSVVEATDWNAILQASSGTALSFVTFRVNRKGLRDPSGAPMPSSLEGLPPMALVLAARDIDLEAQPDEGPQAEVARAQDAHEQAAARAEELRATANALRDEAQTARERLALARSEGAPAEERTAAEGELESKESEATAAERKAAKAEAKAKDLEQEAATAAGGATDPPPIHRSRARRSLPDRTGVRSLSTRKTNAALVTHEEERAGHPLIDVEDDEPVLGAEAVSPDVHEAFGTSTAQGKGQVPPSPESLKAGPDSSTKKSPA